MIKGRIWIRIILDHPFSVFWDADVSYFLYIFEMLTCHTFYTFLGCWCVILFSCSRPGRSAVDTKSDKKDNNKKLRQNKKKHNGEKKKGKTQIFKGNDQNETLIFWRQGSFALMQCFCIFLQSKTRGKVEQIALICASGKFSSNKKWISRHIFANTNKLRRCINWVHF